MSQALLRRECSSCLSLTLVIYPYACTLKHRVTLPFRYTGEAISVHARAHTESSPGTLYLQAARHRRKLPADDQYTSFGASPTSTDIYLRIIWSVRTNDTVRWSAKLQKVMVSRQTPFITTIRHLLLHLVPPMSFAEAHCYLRQMQLLRWPSCTTQAHTLISALSR